MSMQLDHVFVFVDDLETASKALMCLGLEESFRRRHPGQGTENICFCFENAYLELLTVSDRDGVRAPALAATKLWERSQWRSNGANPFGISFRLTGESEAIPFPTWDYRPPYLPEGMSIPVAVASDDLALPFVFRSPGSLPPSEWTDGRAGNLQRRAGLAGIRAVELTLPADADDYVPVACGIQVSRSDGAATMRLTIDRIDGGAPLLLDLPQVFGT